MGAGNFATQDDPTFEHTLGVYLRGCAQFGHGLHEGIHK